MVHQIMLKKEWQTPIFNNRRLPEAKQKLNKCRRNIMEQDKKKKEWQTPILHKWEPDTSNEIEGKPIPDTVEATIFTGTVS